VRRVGLDEELGCEGYFGFGTGFALGARHAPMKDGESACNLCSRKQGCWERHKARVREQVPDLVDHFKELVRQCGGDAARAVVFYSAMVGGGPDPYTLVAAGNAQDGALVGQGGKPKDRGPWTLPWPIGKKLP